jgi:hypothetical protein
MVGHSITAVRTAGQPIDARQALYAVEASGVPESAAVRLGVDPEGRAAVCISGWAYDPPAMTDTRLKARYAAPRPVGMPVPQLTHTSEI